MLLFTILERSDLPQNLSILSLALTWARERPKGLQGRPKRAKGSPKEAQGHPKGSRREPKSHRRRSKTPKGSQNDQIYIANSRSTAPADVMLSIMARPSALLTCSLGPHVAKWWRSSPQPYNEQMAPIGTEGVSRKYEINMKYILRQKICKSYETTNTIN